MHRACQLRLNVPELDRSIVLLSKHAHMAVANVPIPLRVEPGLDRCNSTKRGFDSTSTRAVRLTAASRRLGRPARLPDLPVGARVVARRVPALTRPFA
jgi:hypothetical protein